MDDIEQHYYDVGKFDHLTTEEIGKFTHLALMKALESPSEDITTNSYNILSRVLYRPPENLLEVLTKLIHHKDYNHNLDHCGKNTAQLIMKNKTTRKLKLDDLIIYSLTQSTIMIELKTLYDAITCKYNKVALWLLDHPERQASPIPRGERGYPLYLSIKYKRKEIAFKDIGLSYTARVLDRGCRCK